MYDIIQSIHINCLDLRLLNIIEHFFPIIIPSSNLQIIENKHDSRKFIELCMNIIYFIHKKKICK